MPWPNWKLLVHYHSVVFVFFCVFFFLMKLEIFIDICGHF